MIEVCLWESNSTLADCWLIGNQDHGCHIFYCLSHQGSHIYKQKQDFPGGSDSKASVYNARDLGSSPGLGRSPGEGDGNPLQYYCLENPMERGDWQATLYGVAKSQTQLSDFTHSLMPFSGLPWQLSWVGKILWRRDMLPTPVFLDFHGGSDGKQSVCNVGDLDSISGFDPQVGKIPGEGHGNPLHYSCLENLQGHRSLASYNPWGCTESDTTKPSTYHFY